MPLHTSVNTDEVDLPDEIVGMLAEEQHLSVKLLDTIGQVLMSRRKEAIDARVTSGIEDIWMSCEEAYAGIDDANRHEFPRYRWSKPAAMHVPVTTNRTQDTTVDNRSTAFVRLTARYVDAGTAKLGEILLPVNDKAFSFSPTPVPDLQAGAEDGSPIRENGQMLMRPMQAQEAQLPPGQSTLGLPEVPITTKDLVEETMARATKSAKKAETRIYDQMVECHHRREVRKVLFDSCRLGVGILKGPFPDIKRQTVRINGTVQQIQKIVPADKWVNPWDIYPDAACGEDIRNGDYIWEHDTFSEKQVRKLIGLKGYVKSQIEKVLLDGPKKSAVVPRKPTDQAVEAHPYDVWYYYGTMKKEDLRHINDGAVKDVPADKELVYALVTMVNDVVVHGTLNPLDSGDFPYHAVPWLRRPGRWDGVGVGEQLFVPQRIVNAATRALLNNAGISAGPQIIINYEGVRPANGEWALAPNKIWYLTKEGLTDDVQKAFYSFDVTNVESSLMHIVEYGMRLGEESTNIPLVTQGLSGRTTPETLGATQLQDNNANQLLRAIGYSFDDYLTEPLVQQWHEYHLLDPDVPEDEKLNLNIQAHGSIAMVERAIQKQFVIQMTAFATPVYGVNPRKWFKMISKSNHMDPEEVCFTEEELKKLDSQPPPAAPAVEVAKIKAQTDQMRLEADAQRAQEEDALAREIAQLDAQTTEAVEQLRNQTAQLKVQLDTDRDTAYVQAEMERSRADFTNNMETLKLKREIAQLEYAAKHQLSLDQVKSKLTDTAMKLRVAKELAAMDAELQMKKHVIPGAKTTMKPPAQVPGKAGQGNAFSQL